MNAGHARATRGEGQRTVVNEATTSLLARYAVDLDFRNLPGAVRREVRRLFLNWVGCALGGSTQEAIAKAIAAVREFAGPAEVGILGRSERLDALNATLINCMSSAVLTFDDTHLPSITHPSGPVVSTALAVAERKPVPGSEFVAAVALGIEASCRMGAMLTVPPARSNTSLFMTGIAGTIGSAIAAGKLMKLDQNQLQQAIGLAATQSAGLREMHGTMASSFVCGNAARSGLLAATFAKHGFTSGMCSIEGPKGYGNVFGNPACTSMVSEGLGSRYELLSLTYKPYPCGVAIHPVIDAARQILDQGPLHPDEISTCEISVHPIGLILTARLHPTSALEAQVSIPHWIAATLLHGTAGLSEATEECVHDPAIAALRARVKLRGDERIPPTGAAIRIVMADGRILETSLEHCRGSVERPMSEGDLEEKFVGQAMPIIGPKNVSRVIEMCRAVEAMEDVGAIARVCAR